MPWWPALVSVPMYFAHARAKKSRLMLMGHPKTKRVEKRSR